MQSSNEKGPSWPERFMRSQNFLLLMMLGGITFLVLMIFVAVHFAAKWW